VSKRPSEQLGRCIQSVSLGASRRIYGVADAKFQIMFKYLFFMVFSEGNSLIQRNFIIFNSNIA